MKQRIDLNGPNGNAFYIMGLAKNLSSQLGYSKSEQTDLINEMKSGNYKNLLNVFEKHFGNFIEFINKD